MDQRLEVGLGCYCTSHLRSTNSPLQEIAPKFPHTLFLRASVADIPFLVGKFGIQVLPCVHAFVDGACVDR